MPQPAKPMLHKWRGCRRCFTSQRSNTAAPSHKQTRHNAEIHTQRIRVPERKFESGHGAPQSARQPAVSARNLAATSNKSKITKHTFPAGCPSTTSTLQCRAHHYTNSPTPPNQLSNQIIAPHPSTSPNRSHGQLNSSQTPPLSNPHHKNKPPRRVRVTASPWLKCR